MSAETFRSPPQERDGAPQRRDDVRAAAEAPLQEVEEAVEPLGRARGVRRPGQLELRELVELTRQHAEAVRKVMEMLGNKTGKVLRLRSQDPRE